MDEIITIRRADGAEYKTKISRLHVTQQRDATFYGITVNLREQTQKPLVQNLGNLMSGIKKLPTTDAAGG